MGAQGFWQTGCWLTTESFNTAAGTSGMQVGITEQFCGRSSPLLNIAYTVICVSGAISFSQSLKGASKFGYLMTGKIPICLEASPLESADSSGTHRAEYCTSCTASAIQDLTLICAAIPSHSCEEPHPWLVLPQQAKPALLRLWPLPPLCWTKHSSLSIAVVKHTDCCQAVALESSKDVKPSNRTGQEL